MKNFSFWSLGLAILVCSSSAIASDLLPDVVPDPFLVSDNAPSTSSITPSLASPTPPDTPAPSLGSETNTPAVETPAPTAAAKEPEPKTPAMSEPVKAVAAPTGTHAAPGKDIYEQYDEYLETEKERKASEIDITQRSLFPHENGAWQINVEYIRNAFGDYDFNNKDDTRYPKTWGETSGPGASLLFFPLKSLSFGRLGLGVTGAYYWSKFNLDSPTGAVIDKPGNGTIYTYGGKAVYELNYWLGQILVPFVYYGYDQVFVRAYSGLVNGQKVTDFPSYRTTSQSYGAGLHFNLNRVEPTVASRALVNVGIRKFYLTYRANQRKGEFAGLTHSLGLSFEF